MMSGRLVISGRRGFGPVPIPLERGVDLVQRSAATRADIAIYRTHAEAIGIVAHSVGIPLA